MAQLGDPQYTKIFVDKTATHVCTGVEYGLDAVFVFERDITDDSSTKHVSGSLHADVKELAFAVEGNADIDFKDTKNEYLHKTSCGYMGDYIPKTIPTSFKDAVDCLKTIPAEVKDAGQSILTAKIIHIYPLSKLDKGAAVLVRLIDEKTVSSLKQFVESYENLNDDIQSYLDQETVKTTPFLKTEVGKLKEVCQIAKENLMREIRPLLSQVRGGEKETTVLIKILEDYQASKFSPNVLKQYLKLLTVQISCVQLVINYVTEKKSG